MSKRTASEAEDDTVANVADIVWGFITGRDRFNQVGIEAATSGMDEVAYSAYLASIARVSREGAATAERLRKANNLHAVTVDLWRDYPEPRKSFRYTISITDDIYQAIVSMQSGWLKDGNPIQKIMHYLPPVTHGELHIREFGWSFGIRRAQGWVGIVNASPLGN